MKDGPFPCTSCALPCETGFELDNNLECDSCRVTRKVIIAGGRDFNDYELLKTSCDKILNAAYNIEIVSGGAKGADKLGERYAKEKGLPITVFEADWEKFSLRAGPIRNKLMSNYSDYLIAFYNGSRGTANMIATAKKDGLKIRIVKY